MSSTNSGKRYLLIAGRILILLIVLIGAVKSGTPWSYYEPHGFFFVLVGGVALMMISFPGAEIWRAFRHAAGGSGDDAEIRNSAHFWEAAGRGFWILGGLSSVLSMIVGFAGLKTVETAGLWAIIPVLLRPLLSTFYGSLLAVICFVPCWKLMGKLQSRLSTPGAERSDRPASYGRTGWGFGTVIGYVLFLAALVSAVRLPNLSLSGVLTACIPSFLVVLGGTLALMLFMGGNNARLTPSTAFAGMGLIGCLMGFIQMLRGMTIPSAAGIGIVAGAIAFVIASCFTSLLGMALVGAPLEDRAIRTGRVEAPSAFSRVSWYVFPLLSLIFQILVFINTYLPLPPAH
jgi:flagellar motor component MotA